MYILWSRCGLNRLMMVAFLGAPPVVWSQRLSVEKIIANSVAANQRDFEAKTHFNWKERDRTGGGSKTSEVKMIDGTPYYRLISLNGKPLSPSQQAQENKKSSRPRRRGRPKALRSGVIESRSSRKSVVVTRR